MSRRVEVSIDPEGGALTGDLELPDGARSVVAFAHGSGSSRKSPRNRFVAEELRKGGLGTLLIDLLTAEEEEEDLRTRSLRFDIELLADRMVRVVDWLDVDPDTAHLGTGIFGASTGAAAALVAAARRPGTVRAVVSRGGRPDLAAPVLPDVTCPTLLIVGSLDAQVIALNRDALALLPSEADLVLVPGATHLFEEPGTLAEAARLARDWFVRHLPAPGGA
jgi:putative phosphoribosyl transferase